MMHPGSRRCSCRAWQRAGLPPGVLSILHGAGKDAAGQSPDRSVDAGHLNKISFNCSTAVGRKIGEVCGPQLQQPSLDLGGRNPLGDLADADLDLAVERRLWAAFGTAGHAAASAGNIIGRSPSLCRRFV